MSEQANKPTFAYGNSKDEVLARLNFQAFFQKYLAPTEQLRKEKSDGWSNRVLCPIHKDRDTPNLFFNLETGKYKCQACGSGGDVFDFWMVMNNLNPKDKSNFRKALEGLAAEAGVDLGSYRNSPLSSGKSPAQVQEAKTAEQIIKQLTENPTKAENNDKLKVPVAIQYVEELQKNMGRDQFSYLNKKRGLTKRTIEEAQIGFDLNSPYKFKDENEEVKWGRGRYALPVFDKDRCVRNIRLYSPLADSEFKMINYVRGKDTDKEEGFGKPVRLYQLHKLVHRNEEIQNVIICEGEWDCLLTNQLLEDGGYKSWIAVTGTHGANSFDPDWIRYFLGKSVYFVYDCDEPGKLASTDHVNMHFLPILSYFASVHLVTLPLEGSKEMKDLSDYFLKAERSVDDLVVLCSETPQVIVGGVSGDQASQEAIEVPDFIQAIKNRQFIDKRIKVPLTISGATSRVYHAIRSYAIARCPLFDRKDGDCCSAGAMERTIPYGHSLFIEACMEKEVNVLKSIARFTCQKDQPCSVRATSKVVMEEYFAHQVVERWRAQENDEGRMQNTQELMQTSVYILQPPNNLSIEPQNYMATGFVRTHPKTSVATFFIEHMEPMEEDWKKFTVESPDNRYMLQTLKSDFTTKELMDDLTQGVTFIYEMDEILLAVLMAYLAPLWIRFNGKLQRGWLNVGIIGDSGTGKTATYTRFSDWIELGDLFSALSGTRTGLLYAIKRRSDEWYVSIGRYVQASCKIIAIDETQEIEASEIKRAARAMDEGFLKIDQVASGGYHTQTRAIFLMNPKDVYGKAATISDFTFGCDALRMSFDPMFTRRLDFAIFTTGNQNHEFYNRRNAKEDGGRLIRLTPRMMRTLIYWAWTRRADQILWTEEATKHCLTKASELSGKFGYADQIPLVNPQDIKEKLARMATAYAILDRNFTEDFECVTVDVPHVEFVTRFLETVYSAPACNLAHKSKAMRSRNTMEDYEKIRMAFEDAITKSRQSTNRTYQQGDFLLRMLSFLQTVSTFRKRDIAEQLNVNIQWVTKRILIFQGYNLVEPARSGGFRTTRKFNIFMQTWRQNEQIDKLFEQVHEIAGRQALQQRDSLEPLDAMDNSSSSDESYESYYTKDPFQDAK